MKNHYLLGLALCLATQPTLTAQQTAEQLTNFNYGTTGQDALSSIHAVNGTLYGNFNTVYGDHDAGLLSIINRQTGSTTALLSPDQTYWFGGQRAYAAEPIVSRGGRLFGIQRDLGQGTNLYRLDGPAPVLLHTSYQRNLTNPVEMDGALYFLSGAVATRTTPRLSGGVPAELWRTDGTRAGTTHVASLPVLFNNAAITMVAGDEYLLLDVEGGRQLYYYDPVSGEQGYLEIDGVRLTGPASRGTVGQPRTVYHDGTFYTLFTNQARQTQLLAITDGTHDARPVNFSQSLTGQPFVPRAPILLGDDVYVYGYFNWEYHPTFFRPNPTAAASEATQIPLTGPGLDYLLSYDQQQVNYVTTDSSLISIGFRNDGEVALTEIVPASGRAKVLAVLPAAFQSAYLTLTVGERYAFVGNVSGTGVARVDLLTGQTLLSEAFNIGYGFGVFSAGHGAYFQVIGDDAYWLQSYAGQGQKLVRWSGSSNTPVTFGNFNGDENSQVLQVLQNQYSTEPLLLQTDRLYEYTGNTDGVREVVADVSNVALFRNVDGVPVYSYLAGENETRYARYQNGEFIELTLASDLETDDTRRLDLSNLTLPDGREVHFFTPSAQSFSQPVTLQLQGNVLQLNAHRPGDQGPGFFDVTAYSTAFYDGEVVFHTVYGATNEIEYVFDVPFNGQVMAISPDGAWAEINDPTTGQPTLLFYSNTGDIKVMDVSALPRAQHTSRGRLLNGRLVYLSSTAAHGRELAAADPVSGRVELLKDIAPGRDNSMDLTFYTQAIPGGLLFAANDGTTGTELWYTDGTPANTRRLADLNPGPGSSSPYGFVLHDKTVYFGARGPAGQEVYRVGVGSLQPELILDINDGPGGSAPLSILPRGDELLLRARGGAGEAYELFRVALSLVPTREVAASRPAKIYPNPVGRELLTIEAPVGEGLVRAQVLDQLGRVLREANFSGTERGSLDLSDLPVGGYWLRTGYGSGRFGLTLVMVQGK